MEVAEGVHRLTQGVANFYLVEEAGKLTLVDAGTPKDWSRFTRYVEKLGNKIDDLDTVLLTHAHADHIGFAERARTAARARVWVHNQDAELARTGKPSGGNDGTMARYLLKAEFWRTLWVLGRGGATKIIPVHEVSTFGDQETLDVPGRPRVVHAPGHTSGCAALLLDSRGVLLTGDVVCTRNPLTGRVGPQIMPAAFNRDSKQALASLDQFDGVPAGTLLPGHGEPWTHGVEEAIRAARTAGIS